MFLTNGSPTLLERFPQDADRAIRVRRAVESQVTYRAPPKRRRRKTTQVYPGVGDGFGHFRAKSRFVGAFNPHRMEAIGRGEACPLGRAFLFCSFDWVTKTTPVPGLSAVRRD